MSSDGQKLAAIGSSEVNMWPLRTGLVTSNDGGISWTEQLSV